MIKLEKLISLHGRLALVTGATGNLGRVLVETLAELGADLIIVDRSDVELESFGKCISEKWGVSVENYSCDLEQHNERLGLINWLTGQSRNLNILINNAAYVGSSNLQGWSVPFEDQSIETWRSAFEVNLTSAFHLIQGLMPVFKDSDGANIINISSIYGMYAPDWSLYEGTNMSNPAAYSVSKGGLLQLTRWLATTLKPSIRVNSISPGGILRSQPKEFIAKYELRTPLGRMAKEEDFRGVVAFLASDMSAYITGQNIVVDGGWGI